MQLGEWGKSEDRMENLRLPTAVALNERTGDIVVCDTGHKLVRRPSQRPASGPGPNDPSSGQVLQPRRCAPGRGRE